MEMWISVWDCQLGHAAGCPLLGHTDIVWSVCTDGLLIISGSIDKTIRIWDLMSSTQIGSPINAGGNVYAVNLFNDGRIAAGVDCAVQVWDVKTRRRIALMGGHTFTVSTVAVSCDNLRIASGSYDKSIRLWDTVTYTQIWELSGHTDPVRSVSFSPDGRWITSGGNDDSIRIWHCDSGQLSQPPLQGHTDIITSVAISRDGCQLISGSQDETIRIWSKFLDKEWSELSEQITTIHLSQHTAPPLPHMISLEGNPSIVSACYSPDRTLYAASTLGGHVSLWNVAHELLWESETHIHPIHLLRLTTDRLTMSTPDGSVLSWDLEGGNPRNSPLQPHPPNTSALRKEKFSAV